MDILFEWRKLEEYSFCVNLLFFKGTLEGGSLVTVPYFRITAAKIADKYLRSFQAGAKVTTRRRNV